MFLFNFNSTQPLNERYKDKVFTYIVFIDKSNEVIGNTYKYCKLELYEFL